MCGDQVQGREDLQKRGVVEAAMQENLHLLTFSHFMRDAPYCPMASWLLGVGASHCPVAPLPRDTLNSASGGLSCLNTYRLSSALPSL